ncbi:hypothetical protein CHS0354_011327 [Potamilus streckersoni]|uniref:SCL-interrupting locus protein n=1 Tax=Potamilus streckersoni TaxID=2493646 RepID=A0AAE0WD17_9BIVA|nr:hypothetical protein CHS0354_011327 [Potamilus streckersoni]
MAASIKVAGIPDTIRAQYDSLPNDLGGGAYMMAQESRQYQRNSEDLKLLKFPNTKNILWDHTSTGSPLHLHISCYRKPKLYVSEKVLRFAQRHSESTGQSSCSSTLIGSLAIDDDGEGVTFNLERLDPGAFPETSLESNAVGDILIPFTIQNNMKKDRCSSVDDYQNAQMLLRQRCCTKSPVELSNFLLTKGWCNFYVNGEKCIFHLELDVVTMATEFIATPISSVPIVPTALSKNLAGPMSISHMQGEPKTGYLTMDHTRKLLLVLESDPKVINLPLVGIWVSGVSHVYSPFLWACCLRYLFNSSIQDRVCSPPEPFLLVLYTPLHSKPEFYDVTTTSGNSKLTFDLYTGYDAFHLNKNDTSTQEMLEIDLTSVQNGPKRDLFDTAYENFLTKIVRDDSLKSESSHATSIGPDDIMPRSQPTPQQAQLPMMQSMVPEVSLFFGDGDDDVVIPNIPKPRQPLTLSRPSHGHLYSASSRFPASVLPRVKEIPTTSQNDHAKNHQQTSPVNSHNSGPVREPCTASASQQFMGAACHIQQQNMNGIYPVNMPKTPSHQYGVISSQMTNGAQPPPCSYPCCSGPSSGHALGSQSIPVYNQGYSQPNFPYVPNSSDMPRVIQPQLRPMFNQEPIPPRLPQLPHPIQNQPFSNPLSVHNALVVPSNQCYPPYLGSSQCDEVRPHTFNAFNASVPPPKFVNPPKPYQQQQQKVSPISSNNINFDQQRGVPLSCQQGSVTAIPTNAQFFNSGVVTGTAVRLPSNQMQSIQTPAVSRTQVRDELSVFPQGCNSMPGNSTAGQENMEYRRSNNSNHSSNSSDDSGLSVTPEKNNSHRMVNPGVSNGSTSPSKETQPLSFSPSAFKWDQVPPEIYQLLVNQDKQLKQLQVQISQLLSVQASTTTSHSAESVPSQSVEKCDIAVNTSFSFPEPEEKHQVSACIQTSLGSVQSSQRDSSSSGSSRHGEEVPTPMELRHRGVVHLNSTVREDLDMEEWQGDLAAVMSNLQNRTMESIQSDMIVDLPSYHSSPTVGSQDYTATESMTHNMSPRSPVSASMCEQMNQNNKEEISDADEEEEEPQFIADQQEYYTRLMSNIQKLLSASGENSTEALDADTSDPNSPMKLAQHSIRLGEHLQSFIRFNPGLKHTDTTFIPRINYVSMLFDSDSDTSMEINAMAMKYLKDDQLTKLTKLQAASRLPGARKGQRNGLLQKILKEEDHSSPDVTTLGMSPNDLTFATKKYMEKYGLLAEGGSKGEDSTQSESTYNESYQLRMNYSSLSSGTEGPAQLTHEVIRTPTNRRSVPVETRSPVNVNLDSQNHTPHSEPKSPVSLRPSPVLGSEGRTPLGFTPSSEPKTPVSNGYYRVEEQQTSNTPQTRNYNTQQRHFVHNDSDSYTKANPHMLSPYTAEPGARVKYASPVLTAAPSKHTSPPERPNRVDEYNRIGHKFDMGFSEQQINDYERKMPNIQQQFNDSQKQQVPERIQFLPQQPIKQPFVVSKREDEDDRILDITRLKQLPKLL